MIRRTFLATLISAIPMFSYAQSGELTSIGDDGLYKQSWFYKPSMDLKQDFINAQQRDKYLVYIFEQPGCIYCKFMHEKVFTDPSVENFLIENFYIVQLQINGAIPLKDFDGVEYRERDFSRLNSAMGTPTMVFFDSKKPVSGFTSIRDSHLLTIPGALEPEQFIQTLETITKP